MTKPPELTSIEISVDGKTSTLTFSDPIESESFHPAGRWKTGPPQKNPEGSLAVAMGLDNAATLVYVHPGWLRRAWWRLTHWR